jgi:hypothetical protein
MGKNIARRERVTQTFTWLDYETVDSSALFEDMIDLIPDTSSLGSYSAQLANFVDMYRFAKIEKLHLEIASVANVSAATWTSWAANYVAPGAAVPSNLLGIETKNVVMGCGVAGATHSRQNLHMTANDFAVLADGAPGPGWIPTAGDGPATSFGAIYVTSMVPVGAGGSVATFCWKMSLTMSFDTLVDPTTISLRMSRRKGLEQTKQVTLPAEESLEEKVAKLQSKLEKLAASTAP